jgi:hypothetical protein
MFFSRLVAQHTGQITLSSGAQYLFPALVEHNPHFVIFLPFAFNVSVSSAHPPSVFRC